MRAKTEYVCRTEKPMYGIGFSWRKDSGLRVATGSFIEDSSNHVKVFQISTDLVDGEDHFSNLDSYRNRNTQVNQEGRLEASSSDRHPDLERLGPAVQGAHPATFADDVVPVACVFHAFPPTKVDWIPDHLGAHPDLFATTSEALRIWRMSDLETGPNGTAANHEYVGSTERRHSSAARTEAVSDYGATMHCLLSKKRASESSAPLTSFDWNESNPSMIGVSSIDTTCSIWDISAQVLRTQLIAHDKEVFDFAFGQGTDTFASVSADGSVRLFDLRAMDHSTVLYESPNSTPMLRVRWNKQYTNYLAAVMMGLNQVILLDVRVPATPVAFLEQRPANTPLSFVLDGSAGNRPTHPNDSVNSVVWAPHSGNHLLSVGERGLAYLWDLGDNPKMVRNPCLSYHAGFPINNASWSSLDPSWVGMVTDSSLRVIRI